MKLILASASPRRAEILKNAGFSFAVRISQAEETLPAGISPQNAAEYLAGIKADASPAGKDEVVLAADTVVSLDGAVLGKPKSEKEAFFMLRGLSGKTHTVFTGVAIQNFEKRVVYSVKTEVTFFELSDSEIERYIQTGEPFDKAGAYGIQGRAALFVEKINGDYLNVVGLPLSTVAKTLEEFSLFPDVSG